MGSVISRCTQDVRNAWKRCSKKQAEEETMLSTCDSEPVDKCGHEQLLDPFISSGVDRTSRTGSPVSVHRLENTDSATCHLLSSQTSPGVCSLEDQDLEDQVAVSTVHNDLGSCGKRLSTLVDRESQTNFEVCDHSFLDKPLLSKAYIVNKYSLHNATPTPSPDIQSKFPPNPHSLRTSQAPESSPVDYTTHGSAFTPLDSLEKRQEDVLKRLEQLQASVTRLSEKYNMPVAEKQSVSQTTTLLATTAAVTTSPTNATGSCHGQALQASSVDFRLTLQDLVISADPSSIPLSIIVLCQSLCDRYRVFMTTFVHSSVSGSVPDKLRGLLTSNSGIKRGDCDLAISLIWKKVTAGLQLVVDPTKQTTIEGEANVARYLARLLNPSHEDADIIAATQVDEILDLAQLQLLEGKSKEKAAAVRALNSQLGKRDWLAGSEPSVADIVCWSLLHQTNQVLSPPANVKKWLNLCGQHKLFQTVLGLVS